MNDEPVAALAESIHDIDQQLDEYTHPSSSSPISEQKFPQQVLKAEPAMRETKRRKATAEEHLPSGDSLVGAAVLQPLPLRSPGFLSDLFEDFSKPFIQELQTLETALLFDERLGPKRFRSGSPFLEPTFRAFRNSVIRSGKEPIS